MLYVALEYLIAKKNVSWKNNTSWWKTKPIPTPVTISCKIRIHQKTSWNNRTICVIRRDESEERLEGLSVHRPLQVVARAINCAVSGSGPWVCAETVLALLHIQPWNTEFPTMTFTHGLKCGFNSQSEIRQNFRQAGAIPAQRIAAHSQRKRTSIVRWHGTHFVW